MEIEVYAGGTLPDPWWMVIAGKGMAMAFLPEKHAAEALADEINRLGLKSGAVATVEKVNLMVMMQPGD